MRVNWLRTKARRDRWAEELKLVQNEMVWTVRGFRAKATEWRDLRRSCQNEPGLQQYAAKQQGMWSDMALKAANAFREEANVNC